MTGDDTGWVGRIARRLADFRESAKLAEEQTGKPLPRQLREIRALRRMGGQCGVTDYYWYKLYDDGYLLGRGAPDFMGWRLQARFSVALNPRNAVLPAWDKVAFMLIASGADLPVAPIFACFHQGRRVSEALGMHLTSTDAVAELLRDPSVFPLFGKPAYSQQGYGAAYLAGYDLASDNLELGNGDRIPVREFLNRLTETCDARYHRPEAGYLFQRALKVAPEIATLTQWPAVCGVRLVCLNEPGGVTPIRAVWKVAVPPNHVDNFSLGKRGNLLGDVDLDTGEVTRVIGAFWPRTRVYADHPVSGQSFSGFRLPNWSAVLDACKRAGPVFPLMGVHHWDVAFTEQGPMILELNDIGATEMIQVHGRGLLTPETRQFLKRRADRRTHTWVDTL